MLRGCVGGDFVYAAGGEYDAPEERALDLIKAGHAERVGVKASDRSEKAVLKSAKRAEKR